MKLLLYNKWAYLNNLCSIAAKMWILAEKKTAKNEQNRKYLSQLTVRENRNCIQNPKAPTFFIRFG